MSSPPTNPPSPAPEAWGPDALLQSRRRHREVQDEFASRRDRWIQSNPYYYDRVKRLLRFLIEPGRRVLEVRCQTGTLLAATEPAYGVGLEISPKLVDLARRRNPQLHFECVDPEEIALTETFDYVVFSHIFDTVDVLSSLERLRPCCHSGTRIVINTYNYLWEPLAHLASRVGMRFPYMAPSWLSPHDVRVFLELAGFEVIRTHRRVLLPKWLPCLSWLFNDVLALLPGLRRLGMLQMTVARLKPTPRPAPEYSVSVIVPCRNERDNIAAAVERIPEMGRGTEILFCDDQSTDGTGAEIEAAIRRRPDRNIRLVHGPGTGKADNVWTGFRAATGDVLMILDGDLAVMPEELPYFFRAITSGAAEFVNGSRLVYPVPRQAMKFSNMLGNKVFGALFSFLLDQPIKDTLCGTKVLWREDWKRIEGSIGTWGIHDRWGDYELLFGAAKLNLRILDLPVHYQERIHGVSKMTRVFHNGVRMLAICWHAFRRLNSPNR